jgi:methyl-accepting chemotaxis protein
MRGHIVREDRTSRGPLAAFRNMKTAGKLLVGFLGVSMLMVAVGVIGISKLATAQASLQGMYRDSLQAIAWLGQVRVDFESSRLETVNVALETDTTKYAAIKASMAALDASVDSNWALYTATDMTGREKFRDDYNLAIADYRKARNDKLLPLAESNQFAEFVAVRTSTILPLTTRVTTDLVGLQDVENKAAAQAVADSAAAYSSARTLIIGFILAALALSIGLAIGIGRMIAGPLRKTVDVLEGLAEGRLDQHLDVTTKDEVGQMAAALNRAMARLREAMGAMGNNAQGLASAAEELSAVSAQMKGSAEESASQALAVSAAAEQVSMNVQTVAAGTEQMGASIREIAKNTNDAAGVAGQAVRAADSAGVTVARLGESSMEIGNVVKVITSIAAQTNLLALNATIEAARAGEAGKGFAVVAGEVKELAQETAKATEEIGRRIDAIQADSQAAVTAINQISGIISQINDTQSTIASAVEEQTATTNEMSRSVTEAATGSTEIAATITAVARTSSDTTAAANSTSQAAGELARMAADLQQLTGQFRC